MKSTEKNTISETPAVVSFDQFSFSAEIQKAILEMGYTSATPIQEQALPILLGEPTDFLGLAATGTGKTAAFGIPLLEKLEPKEKGVQALILCPTRELAKQVAEQMNLLARYKRVKTLAIYGGSDYSGQLRALKDGVSIVVGTPGRIIDHLERGTLILDSLSTIVLDEADEMISMGFKEDIESILERASEAEQLNTWLFSATMGRDIRRIADNFLTNPKQIQINKTDMVTTSVTQLFYNVREDEKPEVIGRIVDSVPGFYGMIFCQTKALVIDLTANLKKMGYSADCLHGDMEQAARERVMKAFKAKDITILIGTDVASRGIDVKDLTHVINYSLPRELDLYVHRIGRTGRGGKEGIAMSLVTPSHMGLVRKIEQMTKSKMTKATLPTDADLVNIKVAKLLNDFNAAPSADAMSSDEIEKIISTTGWNDVIEAMTKEEIVARFLSRQLKAPKEVKADALHPEGGFRSDKRRGYMGRTGGGRDSDSFRGGSRGGGYEKRSYAPRGERSERSFERSSERSSGNYERPAGAFAPKMGAFGANFEKPAPVKSSFDSAPSAFVKPAFERSFEKRSFEKGAVKPRLADHKAAGPQVGFEKPRAKKFAGKKVFGAKAR